MDDDEIYIRKGGRYVSFPGQSQQLESSRQSPPRPLPSTVTLPLQLSLEARSKQCSETAEHNDTRGSVVYRSNQGGTLYRWYHCNISTNNDTGTV